MTTILYIYMYILYISCLFSRGRDLLSSSGWGVLPYMGSIGMCRRMGYGFEVLDPFCVAYTKCIATLC